MSTSPSPYAANGPRAEHAPRAAPVISRSTTIGEPSGFSKYSSTIRGWPRSAVEITGPVADRIDSGNETVIHSSSSVSRNANEEPSPLTTASAFAGKRPFAPENIGVRSQQYRLLHAAIQLLIAKAQPLQSAVHTPQASADSRQRNAVSSFRHTGRTGGIRGTQRFGGIVHSQERLLTYRSSPTVDECLAGHIGDVRKWYGVDRSKTAV